MKKASHIFVYFFLFILLPMSCQEGKKLERDNNLSSTLSRISEEFYSYPEKRDSLNLIISGLPQDSLKNEMLFQIAYSFYKSENENEFRKWNKETFRLSQFLKDTLKIAEAHWDLANFYNKRQVVDSALIHYQKAHHYYNRQGDNFQSSRMLLNIAILQKNVKDFTGSEITTIKALSTLKPLKEKRQLYIGYNNLGIVFNELGNIEKSLEYHYKALEMAKELSDNYLISTTLNNIGVALTRNQKYSEAVEIFSESLDNIRLEQEHIRLYAMLEDNLTYAKFKDRPQLNLWNEFERALIIRDSINHKAGIVINKLHMAEFLLYRNDSIRAVTLVNDALQTAQENNYHRDILSSLLLLSKADSKNATTHLENYIKLNDSLQKEERAIRNKFERIRFETDEYIAENNHLTSQRKWMIAGSSGALLTLSLLFVIGYQRSNNKKLQYKQKQQEANEEIYNLLLEQERKVEEGGTKEKLRISRELHDGILGKLFGVRFFLSDLNNKNDPESVAQREKFLVELRTIEGEIRNISHDLQRNIFPEEVGFLKLTENLMKVNAEVIQGVYSLKSDIDIDWNNISNRIKMNLYRIVQECLNNIVKHSGATFFSVEFKQLERKIFVEIRDEGCGFEINKYSPGIGLKNIKARVNEIGANLQIQSETGTEIRIIIPN